MYNAPNPNSRRNKNPSPRPKSKPNKTKKNAYKDKFSGQDNYYYNQDIYSFNYTRGSTQPKGIRYTVPYQYNRRQKRLNIAKMLYRILLTLIFACAMLAVISGLMYWNLTREKKQPDVVYEFKAPTEKAQKITLTADIGLSGGQYYLPINNLISKLNCTVTGDKDEFSFVNSSSGDFMKFIVNTPVVYINNVEHRMQAASFMNDNKLYVPLSFIENNFSNLNIIRDSKNPNYITIEVTNTDDFSFKLHKPRNLESIDEGEYYSPLEFRADLSAYEKYFNPNDVDEYLTLINQTHPLEPQDYIPPDLTDIADTRQDGRPIQQMREYAAKSLDAFLTEAKEYGFTDVSVTSAYRPYESQQELFNERVTEYMTAHQCDKETAEKAIGITTARPGHSEHQSGLCVDMHSSAWADPAFGKTEAGIWLAENAHHFGFIVRYPEGKTDITGITYEPWHFRYIGKFHASKMYVLDMCLEEYMQHLGKD